MIYDLLIIGAGPAGLIASIYASRYKLNNLVLGKTLGGELALASKVENYPGIISLSGLALAEQIAKQVFLLGGKILYREVVQLLKSPEGFLAVVSPTEKYQGKVVIVATGSERRRLNIPGEKELIGKGVSYCTTCDAPFYKGKRVAVIGGADAAVTGAIHTAEFASLVYLIYRGQQLRAEPIWLEEIEKLIKADKIKVIYQTNLKEILSQAQVAKLKAETDSKASAQLVGGVKLDNPYEGSEILPLDGVFIEIGGVPGTSLVQPLGVVLDERGYVKVNEQMETNISGLFCAGDMVDKTVMKQAITAMASGAIAAASAYKHLKGQIAPPIRGI